MKLAKIRVVIGVAGVVAIMLKSSWRASWNGILCNCPKTLKLSKTHKLAENY